MSASTATPCHVRHVHFAPEQVSGSHRPPAAFRCTKTPHGILQGRIFTLRPSVPFDGWFRNHWLDHRLQTSLELWQARGSAIIALGKGLVFSLVEMIKYVFALIFQKPEIDSCSRELHAQWHGVGLSFSAIISPSVAKEKFLAYWENPANCAAIPNTFYLMNFPKG